MRPHRFIPLSAADAPRLDALYRACEDYHLLADGEPAAPGAGAAAFSDVPPGHAPEQLLLLGAEDDAGKLIAVTQVLRGYPEPRIWWIGLHLVEPEARDRGLGRALWRQVARAALNHGADEIQLGVLDDNTAARRFWEREGFGWLRSTEPRPFGRKTHVVHVLRRALADACL